MYLPDTVRELSKELKVSLAEIARRVGQSPQNLSKKMNKGTLSFDEFEQILKCLGVSMDVKFTMPGGQTAVDRDNNDLIRSQMKILEMQLDVERMKSKYFSDISYNFRTALGTVSGGLELIRIHAADADRVADCVSRIQPAVAELAGLIEDSPFNREAGLTGEDPEEAAREQGKTVRLAGKKALLVDDNDINREIVRELLEDSGIAVEEAVNGRDAVEKVGSSPEGTYDLVLMDLVMPVMDGFQATRQIRSMAKSGAAAVPIVAMTASVSEEDRRQAAEAGMNDFIEKPLDLEKLFKMIRSL